MASLPPALAQAFLQHFTQGTRLPRLASQRALSRFANANMAAYPPPAPAYNAQVAVNYERQIP